MTGGETRPHMDAAAIATGPVPAFRSFSQWPIDNQGFTVRPLTICVEVLRDG
jgi:hypothetical protein